MCVPEDYLDAPEFDPDWYNDEQAKSQDDEPLTPDELLE